MYIYKFHGCGLFRFSRGRARCVYAAPRIASVQTRFNRIISHLFPFPVLFIPLASPRRRPRRRRRTEYSPIADQHLDSAHSRSRPTISSCCFLCQKSTPLRLLHSVIFFSYCLDRPTFPLLFFSSESPSCLSSSSPSPSPSFRLDRFGSHVNGYVEVLIRQLRATDFAFPPE